MTALLIYGASGHASVVADMVRAEGEYELAGFIDDFAPRTLREFCGLPLLGTRDCLSGLLRQGICHMIIAVGDCEARVRLASMTQEHGFSLATAIHPRATVSPSAKIGAGTVVCAGAVVNPGTAVGENVIVNTSATVDHDCIIEDGVHIGPGCHLGGYVRVGRQTWLGIGAIVRDRITIGPRAVVGAGSVVVDDIRDGVVAYGTPAKVVRAVEHAL